MNIDDGNSCSYFLKPCRALPPPLFHFCEFLTQLPVERQCGLSSSLRICHLLITIVLEKTVNGWLHGCILQLLQAPLYSLLCSFLFSRLKAPSPLSCSSSRGCPMSLMTCDPNLCHFQVYFILFEMRRPDLVFKTQSHHVFVSSGALLLRDVLHEKLNTSQFF